MTITQAQPRRYGQFVLLCFVSFFATVSAVDAFFVFKAISTNSGVVTEHAYEKGLNYNSRLTKAKNQPALKERVTFEQGVLRWSLQEHDGKPLDRATVNVKFFRPVAEGYDFEILMENKGKGLYEAIPHFPLKGLWTVKLSAQWDKQKYQTTQELVMK